MKEQPRGRSFLSFNTPSACRWMREWDSFVRTLPCPPFIVFGPVTPTLRDWLPEHYKEKQ
jgi:hypothetical protein